MPVARVSVFSDGLQAAGCAPDYASRVSVASKGTGVFETLKGVAKLVLQELTKTG